MNQFMMERGWHYLMKCGISDMGDGIEKAILLADFIIHNDTLDNVKIVITNKKVHLYTK